MNRTIKFRGLRIDGKGWVYGSRVELKDSEGERVFIVPLEEEVVTINGKEHFHWDGLIEVNPETVGQFTGLTDRNGREIWEGDLVRYHFQNSWCKAEMIFNDGAFRLKGWSHGQLTHTFEVSGNVHEQ
jgi:uncharacterized phage protein (TIGR01671 family)